MESLLEQEDTDKNLQITILDNGPKVERWPYPLYLFLKARIFLSSILGSLSGYLSLRRRPDAGNPRHISACESTRGATFDQGQTCIEANPLQ